MPPRNRFPGLNNAHNLKNVVQDFHLPGETDDKISLIAQKEARIIVTKNAKDFETDCKKLGVDIIDVPNSMENQNKNKKKKSYFFI